MGSIFQGAILPFAKFSGMTSFSALNGIKKSLHTKKVGHTGTLDSFADGLLIAVIGKYTKLASYITNCNKEYLARFTFGTQTDTLDPHGEVILETDLPDYDKFVKVIPEFTGVIEQIPPKYSAVHINGKRASEAMRSGETIELKARNVEIYNIEVLKCKTENNAPIENNPKLVEIELKIKCSKGTYIRSLARDIALKIGSSAHVSALRRISIGEFSLENAVGSHLLPDFSANTSPKADISDDEIVQGCLTFTPTLAEKTGLNVVYLDTKFIDDFKNGRFIKPFWFQNSAVTENENAVFCENTFCGIISYTNNKYEYNAVFLERGM